MRRLHRGNPTLRFPLPGLAAGVYVPVPRLFETIPMRTNEIQLYFHCRRCDQEVPASTRLDEWARIARAQDPSKLPQLQDEVARFTQRLYRVGSEIGAMRFGGFRGQ